MYNPWARTISFLFFLFFFINTLFVPSLAFADGMVIYRPDPYSNRWDFAGEEEQQAFISYLDGIERMVVAIRSDRSRSTSGSLWLFPVPSDAQKVVVDVVNELPKFSGEEVELLAKSKLANIKNILLATQIYPIPYLFISSFMGATLDYDMDIISAPKMLGGGSIGRVNQEQDVQVVEHLEKEGMVTEVITAKTAVGLYEYFKSKELTIQEGSIPVLDRYIGNDYSFVASWSNQPAITGQKAVLVTFPTKRIYYPLMPTSVYGSKVVPSTIRVLGHVSPDIYQDIKPYTRVKRYVNSYIQTAEALSGFWPADKKEENYTKIEIQAPSKLLTSDLWISRSVPIQTVLFTMIGKHSNFSSLLLLATISIFSSLVWALALYPAARSFSGLRKYMLVGITNCLSLIGVIVATIFIKTKNISIDEITLTELKHKGYLNKRRLALMCIFTVPIVWLVGQAVFLATIAFMSELMGFGSISGLYNLFYLASFGLFPTSYLIFIIAGTFFLMKKLLRVKPEDQPLFDRLKEQKINSLTLVPKDGRKLAFIPLFSLTFIVLSLFVLKVVENSNAQEVSFIQEMPKPTPTPFWSVYPTSTPFRTPTLAPWPVTTATVYRTPTPPYPNAISATNPCPTGLKGGMCELPNCSYTYPNDIYTAGYVVVGTKYKPEAKAEGYYYDECTSDNRQIKEMVCIPTSEGDYTESSAIYNCPFGCRNGTCIK